ncbi:hypothetical protein PpBr36_01991 [Pyricularia pennisetigena]|uniref:hypothetical protein n=1 Tax=Pyricularia pennisetigena TaxID=1578925 RepID=UPI001150CA8F|nr:hypothetical protein PpBr36_01991 [Pyricularia pennisetigena]TLS29242.1 hypothetical protein PpBr36_01991 [Pyricularia pennisetigena]
MKSFCFWCCGPPATTSPSSSTCPPCSRARTRLPNNIQGSIIDHRGYFLPAASGTFLLSSERVDDVGLFWVGEKARGLYPRLRS